MKKHQDLIISIVCTMSSSLTCWFAALQHIADDDDNKKNVIIMHF